MPKNMEIKLLRSELKEFIKSQGLEKKWQKAKFLFQKNIKHPSLRVKLLEPKWRGIYSFQLDKKYRALFFITNAEVEIFQITKHYKKS